MSNSLIYFINRETKKVDTEKVYKEGYLKFLYGNQYGAGYIRKWILPLLTKNPLCSKIYGFWQNTSFTKSKIPKFITDFQVDAEEFASPVSDFQSFNDFFIRKLKSEARPIFPGKESAIIPADGRYYFYQDISKESGFIVKDQKFSLAELLQNEGLAHEYQDASMVMARLCPSDYHRFHFPCDCTPEKPSLINGFLYSVNPIAVKQNIKIFTENKRELTILRSEAFGEVLFLEVGATNVGSIKQTFTPSQFYPKGSEKGYFEFGGSALILLFKKGAIQFDRDLLEATSEGIEIRCLFGQSMGRKFLD